MIEKRGKYMESWMEYQGMKVPLLEQVTVINKIFWGLQKLDDGYNIYTDFPLKNKPMKGIRCCLYINTDPKYTMEFYHDDKGNHLGTVTENGHANFPFPDEEPFASCFADKMDMSTCRPVPPEELAELNRTLGAEYHVTFKS
jgi:hypothetical protein